MLHLKSSKKLAYLLFLVISELASAKHPHQKAHEHGHAKLEVIFDGTTIKTNLEVPASNIIGFEHSTKSSEEKKTIEDAKELLKKPSAIISSPNCQQKSQLVKLLQEESSHSEFEIQIELECSKVPNEIEVTLFKTLLTLKHTEKLNSLEYEYQGPKGQSAGSLSPKENRLKL